MIINKDEDIFTSIVEYYSINRSGEESESSEEEEEVIEIAIVEALRYMKILKL